MNYLSFAEETEELLRQGAKVEDPNFSPPASTRPRLSEGGILNGELQFESFPTDGYIILTLSNDLMSATVDFFPRDQAGRLLTMNMLSKSSR